MPISRASNQFYALFVASVAAGRPRLTEDAIRATEARTFLGEEAVKLGLADAIGSLEEALAGPGQARRHPTTERTAMTETTAPAAERFPAPNGKRVNLEVQSNPISLCTQPGALRKGTRVAA